MNPIPNLTDKRVSKFWRMVSITANDDRCWLWNGSVNSKTKQYGRVTIEGVIINTHRLAYFIHYKIDPKDKLVCHSCDNPKCVNPKHLWLGTEEDNRKDMYLKRRNARGDSSTYRKYPEKRKHGEKNCCAKLTEENVLEIKTLYASGDYYQMDLARKFGVSQTAIWYILNGRNWKYLNDKKQNATNTK